MDFNKLSRVLPSAGSMNGTQQLNLTDLSPTILDALIPGYSVISKYMQTVFGIDISLFVTIGVIFLAVSKGGRYLFSQIERAFRYLLVSSIYIEDSDDLFDMVMTWLDSRAASAYHRRVRAKTPRGSQLEDANDSAANEAIDDNGLFDYNKWAARVPPKYEAYYGRHVVWHEGRVFLINRSQRPAKPNMSINWGREQSEDLLQLDCIGRSTKPIKELLKHIKAWSINKKSRTTTIRHPTPKDRARYAGAWSKTSSRPCRPMDTVILDSEQKTLIVKDMNEYLHPASPKWYATRGIPYRRGYLFHGPPGTGKTSLSFALAGIFGLDIYAISLQEPTLTEGDLMQLFNGLPRRCIVLLEDVDAAGLIRDEKSDNLGDAAKDAKNGKKGQGKDSNEQERDSKTNQNKKTTEDYTLKDLAKELKAISTPVKRGRGGPGGRGENGYSGHPNRAPGTGISLSGLLNAIDGVATHEGRTLIMTTNHPEKLDAALVRPGRVDRKVSFQLAMKEQVKELFVRMYAASEELSEEELSIAGHIANGSTKANGTAMNGSAHKSGLEAKQTNGAPKTPKAPSDDEDELASLSVAELEELAVEFAFKVPEDMFTPAEVQNHLMKYKKQPSKAVAFVERWKNEMAEEKERQDVKEGKVSKDVDESEDSEGDDFD